MDKEAKVKMLANMTEKRLGFPVFITTFEETATGVIAQFEAPSRFTCGQVSFTWWEIAFA